MDHDGGAIALVPSQIVATWPRGSFAENLAVDAAGAIFVTLHTDNAIVRVDPATGAVSPFAVLDRPVTGIAFDAAGAMIVSGGAPGTAPGAIWRITPDGRAGVVAEIAEASFLNGVTPHGARFLIADSLGSVIYAVDPAAGAVERWLSHPLLAPEGGAPGANGLKFFGGDLFVSNTATGRLLHIRVDAATGRPAAGEPEIVAEGLRGDDFAFDEDGSAYVATHRQASLVRLGADGRRTTLAGAAQGMVGSTAAAFGRTPADRDALYVTTTGGTWTLPEDRLEPAKLVRLAVGKPGHPLLPEAAG